MNNKTAAQVSWGQEDGSYWRTLNPLSGFFGGGDRIPEWWVNMFPKGGEQAAYLTFKTGACALLAAGLVGGYRALKHFDRVADMAEADNPAGKLKSQLSTTFSGKLSPDQVAGEDLLPQSKKKQKKSKGQIGAPSKTANIKTAEEKPSDGKSLEYPAMSWSNFFSMAAPVGATLLAAGIAYKSVDELAGKRRNAILDKTIAAKAQATKALMQARARIAKGNITPEEIEAANKIVSNDDIYMKHANADKTAKDPVHTVFQGGISTVGLLSSAMLLATAIGSYKYFEASNDNNLRYKALKKGLKEYAKNKAGMSPITTIPTDAEEFFNTIDEGAEKQTIRNAPVTNPDDLNKPISVTL